MTHFVCYTKGENKPKKKKKPTQHFLQKLYLTLKQAKCMRHTLIMNVDLKITSKPYEVQRKIKASLYSGAVG